MHVFHSLWKARVGNKGLILQISEICSDNGLLLLLTDTEAGSHCFTSSKLLLALPLGPKEDLRGQCLLFFLPPSFFSFSPFGSQILKNQGIQKQLHNQRNFESHHECPGKVQAQKRHKKILTLYLWLIPSTEITYKNKKFRNL